MELDSRPVVTIFVFPVITSICMIIFVRIFDLDDDLDTKKHAALTMAQGKLAAARNPI